MPKEKYEIEIEASPEKVFAHMDEINNVGWHMSGQGSMPLMGSTLKLEVVDARKGEGATYRWKGNVMGMTIDITETVTKWIENREKVWRTIDKPKMIVMSDYVMHLLLTAKDKSTTRVLFEIDYSLPKTPWGTVLGWLLARKYARWCLQRACEDTKRFLEAKAVET